MEGCYGGESLPLPQRSAHSITLIVTSGAGFLRRSTRRGEQTFGAAGGGQVVVSADAGGRDLEGMYIYLLFGWAGDWVGGWQEWAGDWLVVRTCRQKDSCFVAVLS